MAFINCWQLHISDQSSYSIIILHWRAYELLRTSMLPCWFILLLSLTRRDCVFENAVCPILVFTAYHYNDVIMSAMAAEITSPTIVYSTIYSGADQSKHQSSAPLAFVRGIHRWPVNSPHKGPVTRKMSPFDDVITSSLDNITGSLARLWNTMLKACDRLSQHFPPYAFTQSFSILDITSNTQYDAFRNLVMTKMPTIRIRMGISS